MARLGEITLGGHEVVGLLGEQICSAVAFDLSGPSPCDFSYSPSGSGWEVELKPGQSVVIVRTPEQLDRSTLLARGLEQAQRTLDLVSFERQGNLVVQDPGSEHILLFKRSDQFVLRHVGEVPYGVHVRFQITTTDEDGTVKSAPPPPQPVWTPALRFYRLSQTSQDLYEAYRNLFLGFEALLDAIYPKKSKGGSEQKWLREALQQVGDPLLRQSVPDGCSDPPKCIVETQYKAIRLRLFHAKPSVGAGSLDIPGPETVALAYEQLIRVWRQIAQSCLSVRGGEGSGVMTHGGFRHQMDISLSQGLTMYFTEDPTPMRKDDEQISPLGKQVFEFEKVEYLSETTPGCVSFIGSYPVSTTSGLPVIHRICSKDRYGLLRVANVEEGLHLESVDCFESQQNIRLINKGLPKVDFGLNRD